MRNHARPPATLLSCLLAGVGFVACVGRPYTTSLTATSPAPAPDVFACVKDQLKALDYGQSSIDVAENRITARKFDETVRRPDVNFRRIVDRLEIEVAPASGQAMTTLSVTPRTFAEQTTQRGPTEVQERTSTQAIAAAETILQKCGQ